MGMTKEFYLFLFHFCFIIMPVNPMIEISMAYFIHYLPVDQKYQSNFFSLQLNYLLKQPHICFYLLTILTPLFALTLFSLLLC